MFVACHRPCLTCILPYLHLVTMVFGMAIPTSYVILFSLVMTLTLYFSYFESMIGYTNTLRSRLGAHEGLELEPVWEFRRDLFACIG